MCPKQILPLAALAALAAACFTADFEDGVIACGEAGCPDGLVCHTDGFCYRDPPPAGDDDDDPPLEPVNIGLAAANSDAQDRLYAACGGDVTEVWATPDVRLSTTTAWGDIDRDGDPELVFGAFDQRSIGFDVEDDVSWLWESDVPRRTRDVALFDLSGDGDADLLYGNEDEPLRVFEWMFGESEFQQRWESSEWFRSSSVDAAYDDPGRDDYNIAVGVMGGPNVVFHFDEDGSQFEAWRSLEAHDTRDIAWGDIDGDGRPDLAVANWNQPTTVYWRSGFGQYDVVWWSDDTNAKSTGVAWGDIDRDGDPDLAVANWNQPNRIFRNTGGSFEPAWETPESDKSSSVALGDIDNDGDADLIVGNEGQPNRIYRNDGDSWTLYWSSPHSDFTTDVALATWPVEPGEAGLCR